MRYCRMLKLNIVVFAILCFACVFGAINFVPSQRVFADEEYTLALLDSELNEKKKYSSLDEVVSNGDIVSGDTIKILSDELYISQSIIVDFDLTILAEHNVNVYVNGCENYVFAVETSSNFAINGKINFLFNTKNESTSFGFVSVENGGVMSVDGIRLQSFVSDTLVLNNGQIELNEVIFQDNHCATILDNSGELYLTNTSICENYSELILNNSGNCELQMCEISNNYGTDSEIFSQILTNHDIEIIGYENLLDINIELDKKHDNDCKIVRNIDGNVGKNIRSCVVSILLNYGDESWKLNDLIIQTDETDNIQYNIANSPKINSNFDAYFLSMSTNGFVLDSVKFDIEYYIYSQNGKYDLIQDSSLSQFFQYGAQTNLASYFKDGYQFVGWFGLSADGEYFFDKDGNQYNSLFSSDLNEASAIVSLDYRDNVEIYSEPLQKNETLTYGRVKLYSKWTVAFSVVMQCESDSYIYVEDVNCGLITIDEISSNHQTSMISKPVFVGYNVRFTALANQDYIFVGWFTKANETYTMVNLKNYQVNYETGLTSYDLENLPFATNVLYARFVYRTFTISLQKIFIDENNSELPIDILPDNEYIVDASIIKNGVEYTGKDYLEYSGNQLLLRSNQTVQIEINPDVNYHLSTQPILVNKVFKSSADIDASYDFVDNKYLLVIANTGAAGDYVVTLYFQKNYLISTITAGSNATSDNFLGGDPAFAESVIVGGGEIFPAFNIKTNTKNMGGEIKTVSKTANVYLGQDIVVNVNTYPGFKFDPSNSTVHYLNDMDINFEFVYDGVEVKSVRIFNILSDFNVELSYFKLATIIAGTNQVYFDGANQYIAEVKVESGNFEKGEKTSYFEYGSSITFETRQTDLAEMYVFTNWEIVSLSGAQVDLSILGLSDGDIYNKTLLLSNVIDDLRVTAIYNKKIYEVKVIWNGQNGSVEALQNYETINDTYFLGYGENITLKIKPKNEMYVLDKLTYNTGANTERKDENEYVLLTINNVVSNQRVEVSFVANTWWKHVTIKNFEGNGTIDSPYLISNANDLALVGYYIHNGTKSEEGKAEYSKAKYMLTADIDLGTDYFFVPIGEENKPFDGLFDFNYFAVKNIKTENSSELYLYDGLFDKIGANGRVIRQYKSRIPLMIGLSIIGVTVIVAFFIVFRIERRRQKPRKVFVITTSDENKDI